MKIFLLLVTVILSSNLLAATGDRYLCETTQVIQITHGKVNTFQNFRFKFDRGINFIKFGPQNNYFNDAFIENVIGDYSVFSGSKNGFELFHYWVGDFNYSLASGENVTTVMAKCEKL